MVRTAARCSLPPWPPPRRSRTPSGWWRAAPPGTGRCRSRATRSCTCRRRSRRSRRGGRRCGSTTRRAPTSRASPRSRRPRRRALPRHRRGPRPRGVQAHFAAQRPRSTRCSGRPSRPNIIKGGYLRNVIPSEAEATLDIRALPDEDMPAFLDRLRALINDPGDRGAWTRRRSVRPAAPPSRLDTEAFKAIEAVNRRVYGVRPCPPCSPAPPTWRRSAPRACSATASDRSTDTEDAAKGFGAHSDQERILEDGFRKFVHAHLEIVRDLAVRR